MTFLPIVERELRVRARLKSTFRFRIGAASVAIAIVTLVLIADEGFGGRGGSMGSRSFTTLAWLAYVFCLMEGLRNTADCLSEEKRAGTLGLLFLTDLRGHDVVLGKLIATSLNGFYALLAIFPPLAVTLIQGGVTGGEFWRLVLALINALFFSLAAGLGVSAVCRDERRAWGGTLAIIACFAVIPPLLESVNGLPAWLQMPFSPTSVMFGLRDAEYSVSSDRFWGGLWSMQLLNWTMLVAASVLLPRSWQDEPEVAGESWVKRWFARPGARADKLAHARRQLLEVNPVIWLVSRGERERLSLWTFVVVTSALVAGVWLFAMGSSPVGIALLIALLLLHLSLSMWVASEACHLFAGARDSGALELLLSTPLSIREVIKGHLLGLKRLFYRPVLVLMVVEMCLLAGHLCIITGRSAPVQEIIFTVLGVGMFIGVAILDLVAVARYGMWVGLSTKNPGKAVTKTVLHVLVLPMLAICTGPLLPIVGLVKNIIFISYADEKLRRYFRAVVTERYGLGEEARYVGQLTEHQRRAQWPGVMPK